LDRLYEASYVERRLEGTRAGNPPGEGEQPFRAHSYRVVFDRPSEGALGSATEQSGEIGDGDGHPLPALNGHGVPAHESAPTEGSPLKRTPLNSPNDASGTKSANVDELRVSEPAVEGPQLAEFHAAWGTSAIDNLARASSAWSTLSVGQRRAAITRIPAFKAALKQAKRTMPVSSWRYLEERRWECISGDPTLIDIIPFSREWWGFLFCELGRGEKVGFFLKHTLGDRSTYTCKREDTPSPNEIASLQDYEINSHSMEAWRPWLEVRGVRIPLRENVTVFLPSDRPPNTQFVSNVSEDDEFY